MLSRTSFVYLGFLILATSACEVMPGTEAYKIAQAKHAAAELLLDPAAAQFQDVSLHGEYVCGSINGKNRMGAFVGFKRFFVSLADNKALIDPEFKITDLMDAQESCRSFSSNSYSTPSLIAAACERESEQQASLLLQESFAAGWSKHCEVPRGRHVYQPELSLPTGTENLTHTAAQENFSSTDPSSSIESEEEAPSPSSESETEENAAPAGLEDSHTAPKGSPDHTELDRIFGGTPPPRDPSNAEAPNVGSQSDSSSH